jgi:transcriptional regulator with XRE-family HTH domain
MRGSYYGAHHSARVDGVTEKRNPIVLLTSWSRAGHPAGPLVRRHRIDRNLTQEQLAHATGLSVRSVRNVESCRVRPRPDSIRRIADALRLPDHQRQQVLDIAHCQRLQAVEPAMPMLKLAGTDRYAYIPVLMPPTDATLDLDGWMALLQAALATGPIANDPGRRTPQHLAAVPSGKRRERAGWAAGPSLGDHSVGALHDADRLGPPPTHRPVRPTRPAG